MRLVHVKKGMKRCRTGTNCNTTLTGRETETQATLRDYLAGRVCQNDNAQQVLCKAKICGCQSTTGIADIEVKLGYNFLYKEEKHVGPNIITIRRQPDA